MNSLSQLDRYLPEQLRSHIEQCYYVRINAQARLDQAVHDPEFLSHLGEHMALISDHGVVHARDVAGQILQVLDTIHGVLIPVRDMDRLEFMKGYGVMLAYIHDIGMLDFSRFGRASILNLPRKPCWVPSLTKFLRRFGTRTAATWPGA
jgi:hypothetical protein